MHKDSESVNHHAINFKILSYVAYVRLHFVVYTILWMISIFIAVGLKACGDVKSYDSIVCYTQFQYHVLFPVCSPSPTE